MNESVEPAPAAFYARVREILEAARAAVARTVNSAQVAAYWLVGREIVEEQQRGRVRADYGEAALRGLAEHMSEQFGKGWSARNLWHCGSFYLSYPMLLEAEISNGPRSLSSASAPVREGSIVNAVRSQLPEAWQPGRLHPNLSWTHYRALLRVDRPEARSFYEIEAICNTWSARELERPIIGRSAETSLREWLDSAGPSTWTGRRASVARKVWL